MTSQRQNYKRLLCSLHVNDWYVSTAAEYRGGLSKGLGTVLSPKQKGHHWGSFSQIQYAYFGQIRPNGLKTDVTEKQTNLD